MWKKLAQISNTSKVGHKTLERPSADPKKLAFELGPRGKCKVVLGMNRKKLPVLLDQGTEDADQISLEICDLHNIPTKPIKPVILHTTVKGSKSTINKAATIVVDW